jgi:hypothetical protein
MRVIVVLWRLRDVIVYQSYHTIFLYAYLCVYDCAVYYIIL